MGCSSGNSSGSTGCEEDLKILMDQRKRRRMQSNRESARRSRMRKQQHLDGLMGQVSQLREHKNHMISRLNITTQLFLNIEAENSILRAQLIELTHRLDSLNEILSYINSDAGDGAGTGAGDDHGGYNVDQFVLNSFYLNQPIMASADNMLHY